MFIAVFAKNNNVIESLNYLTNSISSRPLIRYSLEDMQNSIDEYIEEHLRDKYVEYSEMYSKTDEKTIVVDFSSKEEEVTYVFKILEI